MRKRLFTLVLTFALSVAMVSTAHAKDEFENGFKSELGAIAARSAVGLGVGLAHGVLHGGVHYNSYYVRPARIHHGRPRPSYRERVVYMPYPPPAYRVERRVYYYQPYYVPPPRVHHTYEYNYYGCR